MKFRLQTRFSITIVSLIIGIIGLLAGILLFQFWSLSNRMILTSSEKMSGTLLDQMQRRGETIARLLADNLVNPLYTYNINEMYELLSTVRHQQDVSFAYVYDADGSIIQDGTKDVPQYGQLLPDAEDRIALGRGAPLRRQLRHNTLEVSIPIEIGDTVLGGLLIGLSMDGIKSEISGVLSDLDAIGQTGLRQNYTTVGLTAFVLVILGIVGALSVARHLISPIRELSEYAGKVGRGEYGERISSHRGDEIGDLINAFNHMSQDLRETTVSKDYVENIISNMSDPLIVLNPSGQIRLVNRATATLLDHPQDALINWPVQAVFTQAERPRLDALMAQLEQNGSLPHVDSEFMTRDGNAVPISLSGTHIRNEKTAQQEILLVAQDITSRIREKEELSRAKESAESANEAKSEFLANMSHELRTPLNHIIGFTEIVVDQHLGELNDIQAEYLTDALGSSRHLLSLINDILDLSKIEAGKLELSTARFRIGPVLENSLIMVKEKASKKRIELKTQMKALPSEMTADERKVKQILYNLLSNAVKFTPEGGCITLAATTLRIDNGVASASELNGLQIPTGDNGAGPEDGHYLHVSVTDTGIGLSAEQLARVFNPFEQVETSYSRQYEGTGLGLSLTTQLVQLHHGIIWGESPGENQGCRFSFLLPLADDGGWPSHLARYPVTSLARHTADTQLSDH
ncbi:MAG: ATP-binding protein [Desulfosarcinaceae bacterium]|nr:ATP-binding protein [Desulfosarcinaceae bacterium]